MNRIDIINTVGKEFLTENIENGEFSYATALQDTGKNYLDYLTQSAKRKYKNIDLRFVNGGLTVLVETKAKLMKRASLMDMEQLQNYVNFEKALTGNIVIAILASTQNNEVRIWHNASEISDITESKDAKVIKSISEYRNIYFGTKNNKIEIIQNTYQLNELLHTYSINEKIRSQFVGTCLLALKNGLVYSLSEDVKEQESEENVVKREKSITNNQIRIGIEGVLTELLNKDLNKAEKLVILKNKVIDSQDVRDLKVGDFQKILISIENNILPYINENTSKGQDLLNLFFTTFNKYVGKSDKNQAFTPDHIVHFMCDVVGVNRNSVVLDPCCGSGAFLVRALTEAMNDCNTEEERNRIKKNNIYGIEYEETAFGLATTNMLIHGDGNSNILQGNCFFEIDNIFSKIRARSNEAFPPKDINIVLMNPPYNAQKKHCDPEYVKTWDKKIKEDPSKGFHFVYEVAKKIKTGKLAVLLPMQCAIGASSFIKYFKKKMLEEHTLDAVFSFPSDMFHPGASAVACCMIFNLGERHYNIIKDEHNHDQLQAKKETFFGYFKDDGFEKRKNIGRIESTDGAWDKKHQLWLKLYRERSDKVGLSVTKKVLPDDEWLAEAYMKTDYSKLNSNDFQKILNQYIGYLFSNGDIHNENI
ncbi:TPA: N-6 DNA methylase [Pasteurella multocida]|nr:N-6 DNA methylase [Pasteurella multocida]